MIADMELNQIREILPHIQIGLDKYNKILKNLHHVDISKDKDFQKLFNHFYRMRQRNQLYYTTYFEYFEINKNKNINFEDVIRYLYKKLNRIEASFSSKLLATINPNKPVWDQYVLQNLGLKNPDYHCKTKAEKEVKIVEIVTIYKEIENWYQETLKADKSKIYFEMFKEYYPDIEISDVKKIDLLLWQSREKKVKKIKSIENVIQKIIEEIPAKKIFDSHYVIDKMISCYSDEYLYHSRNINKEVANGITVEYHRQLALKIKKFEDSIIERLDGYSHSQNIHLNDTECGVWRKK